MRYSIYIIMIILGVVIGSVSTKLIVSHQQYVFRNKATDAVWLALVMSVDLAAQDACSESTKQEAAGACKTFLQFLKRNEVVVRNSKMLGSTFYDRQMYINHGKLGRIYLSLGMNEEAMKHFQLAAQSQEHTFESLPPEKIISDLEKLDQWRIGVGRPAENGVWER